jgi:hypothetical protein
MVEKHIYIRTKLRVASLKETKLLTDFEKNKKYGRSRHTSLKLECIGISKGYDIM